MKINPFKPNSPVNPGMFVGRIGEVEILERALLQTRIGSPTHFMITGERGIGKTSLLLYLNYLSTGKITLNGDKFNFLVLNLDIDANTTQWGIVERIKYNLDTVLGKSEPARKFLNDTWSFIQRINISGSGIGENTGKVANEELLLDQFSESLSNVCERICSKETEEAGNIFKAKYDGIILFFDEADNCSPDLKIGTFLKLLLERLQKKSCNNILIGLAGLPELRNRLYESHQSSVRIFEEIPLGRLSRGEIGRVVDVCLEEANKQNAIKTSINVDAKELLITLSEGFPHFIQQFGYSAFASDKDNIISKQDVENSAFGSRGALEIIGDLYYRYDFYNKIKKDSYRQVLRIMAEDLDGWVSRKKITSKFKGKSGILNNAIKALRDRHIILSKEGEKGNYRLQHKGFALWIKLHYQDYQQG